MRGRQGRAPGVDYTSAALGMTIHDNTSHQGLHMTKKPNAGNSERQRRPIASIALRTGGLMGAVILGGLFVASCGSSRNEVDTTVAAPTNAQTKTVAEEHLGQEGAAHAMESVR